MRTRILIAITALCAMGVSGCSSKGNSSESMAPQGNDSFSARYAESPPAPLNPHTARTQVMATGSPAASASSSPPSAATPGAAPAAGTTTTTTSTTRETNLVTAEGYHDSTQTSSRGSLPEQYDLQRNSNSASSGNTEFAENATSGRGRSYDDNQRDRHVRVNMPLVHVNVDRDTGSVHVDAPFVHIRKHSRDEQSQISIPDRPDQTSAQN
jgi:hypothetical protein